MFTFHASVSPEKITIDVHPDHISESALAVLKNLSNGCVLWSSGAWKIRFNSVERFADAIKLANLADSPKVST